MTTVQANGISIEHDTFGERGSPPLLLVMGLGTQMIQWRAGFCEQLAGRGHFVVRFDNRDVGLSERFDAAGAPNVADLIARSAAGEAVDAAYTLRDMAADALGLMDALDLPRAHVCGASMGGMIAQTMAIEAPERVLSLISIMSSTGNPALPAAEPEAMAALMSPPGTTREEAIERTVRVAAVIGSPGYRQAEAEARRRAAESYDRAFYPVGVARQMAAIVTSGNRRPALERLDVPTLVIHGRDDRLVPLAGGIDTHEAIPGAELAVIDGMGHDLPDALWPEIIDRITAHTSRH